MIVPILALSGQCAGASVPRPASASEQADWPSAASGLIVSPSGRLTMTDRTCDGEAALLCGWGALTIRSIPEGESASVGRQLRLRDRFEGLAGAVADRFVFRFRFDRRTRVLVGADPQGRRHFFAADRGVAGEGQDRHAGGRECRVPRAEEGFFTRATGRVPRRAFLEAFELVRFGSREAPEIEVGGGERRQLGDARDREAQAVVVGREDVDRDRDRDVQGGRDEGEPGSLVGAGVDAVDRRRAQQVVGIAFVVGANDDDSGLRRGRALVEGEVDGRALGQHARVPEHPPAAVRR